MKLEEVVNKLVECKLYLEEWKYSKCLEMLESLNINSLIDNYINKKEINNSELIIIEKIIVILQNIYNNSDLIPPVSDEKYDKVYEVFHNNSDRNIVGAPVNKINGRIVSKHKYTDLRGTFHKAHFITKEERGDDVRKSLEDWINNCNKLYRGIVVSDILVMPKYDGVSVIFECEDDKPVKALLRGDTETNEAIELPFLTHERSKIDFSFANDEGYKTYGVKTEIIMDKCQFEKFKEKYGEFKSPRSAVSSILNSISFDQSMLPFLDIKVLQIQDFNTRKIIIPTKA
jgi:NAD-dependent DNA ligase